MSHTHLHLVIDDAVPFAQEIFGHLGHIDLIPGRDIQNQHLSHADALIIRSRTQVDAELIANSPVKFIGSTVVGLDHVDQPLLAEQGIHFYSAQGCNANSVAEFILKAMLEMAQKYQFTLKDKTLGVIGVGNVGSRLVEKARIIGMNVIINDPPRARSESTHFVTATQEAIAFSSLDECMQADMISVHTPLNKDGDFPTLDLINAERVLALQPHQILINAARGGIVNEEAWKQSQPLAKVIDCWCNEPNIDLDLLAQADIATPHIAGHSFEAKLNGSVMVYQQLCQFFNIEPHYDWQSALPKVAAPLHLNLHLEEQAALLDLLRQTHDIYRDMAPLTAENFNNSYKKFEYYRRNYPIHHEFSCHQYVANAPSNIDNLLIKLGFSKT